MTMWITVLAGCALAYLLKLSGYVVPARLLEGPRISRVTALLPAALLTGLIMAQTFGGRAGHLSVDARLVAVAVALVLLAFRAGFLLVVISAAVVAAGLRAAGWG